MTNGEMIQKVFNCEVCEPIIEDDVIHVIFADKKDSAIGFDWSWWNAEYKESTTKNDLEIDGKLIERIKQIIYNITAEYDTETIHVDRLIYEIENLEPKTGRWISKNGKEQGYDIGGVKTWYIQIMCSECGFIKTAIEGYTGQYHYCPNCGAKMVEPQESEGTE